jgi:hypothetical protein
MPWVTVDAAGTPGRARTYRLPPPLAGWARDVIGAPGGLVAALWPGQRITFPCDVEFGTLEGRPYAEFVVDPESPESDAARVRATCAFCGEGFSGSDDLRYRVGGEVWAVCPQCDEFVSRNQLDLGLFVVSAEDHHGAARAREVIERFRRRVARGGHGSPASLAAEQRRRG